MTKYLFGILSGSLIIGAITFPQIWPPELSLVFNSIFWWSIAMLVISCFLVYYLYRGQASSEAVLFTFSLMLIASSAVMYAGFEEIAINADKWKPYFEKHYSKVFIYLPIFISYTKNIIAFGFAAIGASICANIISYKFYKNS